MGRRAPWWVQGDSNRNLRLTGSARLADFIPQPVRESDEPVAAPRHRFRKALRNAAKPGQDCPKTSSVAGFIFGLDKTSVLLTDVLRYLARTRPSELCVRNTIVL